AAGERPPGRGHWPRPAGPGRARGQRGCSCGWGEEEGDVPTCKKHFHFNRNDAVVTSCITRPHFEGGEMYYAAPSLLHDPHRGRGTSRHGTSPRIALPRIALPRIALIGTISSRRPDEGPVLVACCSNW